MEPLLPSEFKMGPVLERANDLIRKADRLSGWCPPGALPGLRKLLRSMNSFYSNKIEGQHTLPLEIEQALRNDYSQDEDKARRQRLALAHMSTESQLETLWPEWTNETVWSVQTLRDIHQDLFAICALATLERARSVLGAMQRQQLALWLNFSIAGLVPTRVCVKAKCNSLLWQPLISAWLGYILF
jgi:hypothetical protein